MVTPGFLPSRDTRKSLYIVGEGHEQDAEASQAQHILRSSEIGGVLFAHAMRSYDNRFTRARKKKTCRSGLHPQIRRLI